MSVQIIHKNSGVSGKNPTTTQLTNGEIAVNYHHDGPFLSVRDSEGRITRVGGVWMSATAPRNRTHGTFWLDTRGSGSYTLYVFNEDLGTSGTWMQVGGSGGGGSGSTYLFIPPLVESSGNVDINLTTIASI